MSAIVIRATPEPIEVPRIQEVTNRNFRPEILELVADAAILRIVKEGGGDRESLMPSSKRRIDSIYRAIEAIVKGVPFTGYSNYSGDILAFSMSSTSRPKLYVVGETECQCESQQHNGYCVHRTTRALFADYFRLIRADENRQRAYAELGIEVIENTTSVFDTPSNSGLPIEPLIPDSMREMLRIFRGWSGPIIPFGSSSKAKRGA